MKIAISVLFLIWFIFPVAFAQLRVGFYSQSCPNAETIVQNLVRERFSRDPSITAALTRMHFHDCFVRGCDASILIEPTATQRSEKEAGPNISVRGFELIDEIKAALEAQCPSTVSCADIITLATRDSVFLGGGPSYVVPTGRRDGFVSNPDDAGTLPPPDIPVSDMLILFGNKGMDVFDAVALLGAHTVGVGFCPSFENRLTNFQGTGQPDPSMDPTLAAGLRNTCAAPGGFAALDQSTPLGSFSFDNLFYSQIRDRKGILLLDQRIATDMATSGVVFQYAANNELFKRQFAIAMGKMGAVDVLTGLAGMRRFYPHKLDRFGKIRWSKLERRGSELIDEIKTELEAQCPSNVSCADIMVLATRDYVALAGGSSYSTPTGRRDGLKTNASGVFDLIGPTASVTAFLSFFGDKMMNTFDAVALLGAHTVGVGSCSLFRDRLTNFNGTGLPDPSMDSALVANLTSICAASVDPSTGLDRSTPLTFDNAFFGQIKVRRGVLQLDQRLATDEATSSVVAEYAADNDLFKRQFAIAMVKMGAVNVLTGENGEIITNFWAFNDN